MRFLRLNSSAMYICDRFSGDKANSSGITYEKQAAGNMYVCVSVCVCGVCMGCVCMCVYAQGTCPLF